VYLGPARVRQNLAVSERTLKITIAALGGQGGGVLTDWLMGIGEASDYVAQSTSVPGVAQRTGATIYYLEFFPRAVADARGREPIMALMPVPGDVDCVVAAELAEAGRAIQRGLVTNQTTLISSTHRTYAISERSALGSVGTDTAQLLDLVRAQGSRAIMFDMEAIAERRHSVISAVLLGAICGSAVLPFTRQAFEEAIKKSGIAVNTNLAAFADAHDVAAAGGSFSAPQKSATLTNEIPEVARTPVLQGLVNGVRALPPQVRPLTLEGVRRTLDYQDREYAALYLRRVERISAIDVQLGHIQALRLTEATARELALWMTFEDTIRVADLKTRASRFDRVRTEVRAAPKQLVGITEFMRPRVQEIADTMPAWLGAWLLRSPKAARWLGRVTGGKAIRTTTVTGFLLLYFVSGLRRWRRNTLRFREENGRIEAWIANIERLARSHYDLAVEVARAHRLVKGYGETHERGWRSFTQLMEQIEPLSRRPDGASQMAQLHDAALADDEGSALARAISALTAPSQTAV
jgi:indolepyruvate ferredoxin oxidoreductase, beta subunit